jgi:hypothetical protein
LAPISSLPTEVIAAIFSILHYYEVPLAGGKPDHLAWLHVTHVCHQWREIVLNNPLFWNHIDFTKLTLAGAAEMLVRAKKAPLYLKAWTTGYPWDRARFNALQNEVQSRITDICHLEISADASFLHRTLERLASPAPTLESLLLSTELNYELRTISRASIPDTLFDATAPRLSCLHLHRCNISWKSPLLKGLRSLEIRTLSKHMRPSLTDWLDALDEMQQLRELILHSASPIAPPFPVDIERIVTLPFLTHLGISTSVERCALALSHLTLPALTQLWISARSVLLNGSDALKLLPYVVRHSHRFQDTQPLQNMLIRGKRRHIEIYAWPDTDVQMYDLPFWEVATITAPCVALSITCRNDGFTVDSNILDAAMTALPLDNLRELTALDHARLDEVLITFLTKKSGPDRTHRDLGNKVSELCSFTNQQGLCLSVNKDY